MVITLYREEAHERVIRNMEVKFAKNQLRIIRELGLESFYEGTIPTPPTPHFFR